MNNYPAGVSDDNPYFTDESGTQEDEPRSVYPANWPRCIYCGDYAMDGHLTCGRATCDESRARDDFR